MFIFVHPQQITALKKENFNLKLRIYFMEERMQQKCDDSTEDIFKTVLTLVHQNIHDLQFFALHLFILIACDSVSPTWIEITVQTHQHLGFVQLKHTFLIIVPFL